MDNTLIDREKAGRTEHCETTLRPDGAGVDHDDGDDAGVDDDDDSIW